MIKTDLQEVRVDVVTKLNEPKVSIRLVGTKVSLPEKSLVVYIKGARSRGPWQYSGHLGGAYMYFPPVEKGKKPTLKLSNMLSITRNGIPLRIKTWGSNKYSLGDIAQEIEVEIIGFEEHTCEKIQETYKIDLLQYTSKSANGLVPLSQKEVQKSGKSKVKQLSQQLKVLPGVKTMLQAVRHLTKN